MRYLLPFDPARCRFSVHVLLTAALQYSSGLLRGRIWERSLRCLSVRNAGRHLNLDINRVVHLYRLQFERDIDSELLCPAGFIALIKASGHLGLN